jgi:hypothetical protein
VHQPLEEGSLRGQLAELPRRHTVVEPLVSHRAGMSSQRHVSMVASQRPALALQLRVVRVQERASEDRE